MRIERCSLHAKYAIKLNECEMPLNASSSFAAAAADVRQRVHSQRSECQMQVPEMPSSKSSHSFVNKWTMDRLQAVHWANKL